MKSGYCTVLGKKNNAYIRWAGLASAVCLLAFLHEYRQDSAHSTHADLLSSKPVPDQRQQRLALQAIISIGPAIRMPLLESNGDYSPDPKSTGNLGPRVAELCDAVLAAKSSVLLEELGHYATLNEDQRQVSLRLFYQYAPGIPSQEELAAIVGEDAARRFTESWRHLSAQLQQIDMDRRVGMLRAIYRLNPLSVEERGAIRAATQNYVQRYGGRVYQIEQHAKHRFLAAHLSNGWNAGSGDRVAAMSELVEVWNEFRDQVKHTLKQEMAAVAGVENEDFNQFVAAALASEFQYDEQPDHEELNTKYTPASQLSEEAIQLNLDSEVFFYAEVLNLEPAQENEFRRILSEFSSLAKWNQLRVEQVRVLLDPDKEVSQVLSLAHLLQEEEQSFVKARAQSILSAAQYATLIRLHNLKRWE